MDETGKDMIWPKDLREAARIQRDLARRVKVSPLKKTLKVIVAVDAAFSETRAFAAACMFTFPNLTFMAEAVADAPLTFPYVPGYLTFREGPAIIAALKRLTTRPDLILVDGQGIAHPRGIGIASHLGVLLDIPTVGCAKSRLVGDYVEPGSRRGDRSPLVREGKVIGTVLRTRDRVRPVFVSPGHKVSIGDAVEIVLACAARCRIPEPLRRADGLSRKAKKSFGII